MQVRCVLCILTTGSQWVTNSCRYPIMGHSIKRGSKGITFWKQTCQVSRISRETRAFLVHLTHSARKVKISRILCVILRGKYFVCKMFKILMCASWKGLFVEELVEAEYKLHEMFTVNSCSLNFAVDSPCPGPRLIDRKDTTRQQLIKQMSHAFFHGLGSSGENFEKFKVDLHILAKFSAFKITYCTPQ